MVIISPEQFKEAFLNVVVNSEAELVRLWNPPLDRYTDLMLHKLLPLIAIQLKLEIYQEYYHIDSIFYEERDVIHFPAEETWAKYIAIAFEHEHEIRGAHGEISKLQIYNTPLKVLVTYPGKNHHRILDKYSRIMEWADIFSDFSTLRKQLVIFGTLNRQDIIWDFYVYKDGGFVRI